MSHGHSHDSGQAGYEHSDARVGAIVKFIVIMFAVTGIVLFALYGLMNAYKEHLSRPNSDIAKHPLAPDREVPNEPRLEALRGYVRGLDGQTSDTAAEPFFNRKMFKQWNAEWKHDLSTYGYVDPQLGIARIPIERAMELKLKQGFPTAKQRN